MQGSDDDFAWSKSSIMLNLDEVIQNERRVMMKVKICQFTNISRGNNCNVPAMSHVTAKVSCDGAANYCWTVDQLLLDSWPTIVGRWTFGQQLLDSWPIIIGHLAKSGDLDKYI